MERVQKRVSQQGTRDYIARETHRNSRQPAPKRRINGEERIACNIKCPIDAINSLIRK